MFPNLPAVPGAPTPPLEGLAKSSTKQQAENEALEGFLVPPSLLLILELCKVQILWNMASRILAGPPRDLLVALEERINPSLK